MELFTLRDLSFTYPGQTRPALSGVTLSLFPGECVLLAGPSGCGKSTLLRQLKPALAPHGERSGTLLFRGAPLDALDLRAQAERIGFVQQDPDSQIVTDKVWHELAFGLESLGLDTDTIRGRVSEMACFFGMESWFYKDVSELSGGQKQLLNLASVMVMQPEVLLLDEPTSQLDPIAAADFLATVGKINRELGTTVLLTEHRLEEAMPMVTRAIFMEEGRLLCDGTPEGAFAALRAAGNPMLRAMPAPMRVWASVETSLPCPMTVGQGRQFLSQYALDHPLAPVPRRPSFVPGGAPILEAREVWFRYEKDGRDILKGLNFSVYPGELVCTLGGNGAGKTTTLAVLSGARKPYRGTVRTQESRLAFLPQNPQSLFARSTLRQELEELSPTPEAWNRICALCGLGGLLDRHPYDLSGGEQQRAALAKVLLTEPRLLLLDEPTKGLDAAFKETFAGILAQVKASGVGIVMVSHDVEFCAAYADRCCLFFDGGITAQGDPQTFFSGKRFYTTAANRMARHLLPEAVTAEDVIAACGGQLPPQKQQPPDQPSPPPPPPPQKKKPLPLWRKLLGLFSGAGTLALSLYSIYGLDLTGLFQSGGNRGLLYGVYGALFACLALFLLSVCAGQGIRPAKGQRKSVSPKVWLAAGLSLLAIPLTLLLGNRYFGEKKYLLSSILILGETMLPFFLLFEGRRPQARDLVLLAVLCALSVAGRAVFFALPGFKPVAALVIVAAAVFGGETGFLVGAMSMFVSNMLFGQGPWTPWQMFAMGLIGLLTGLLSRTGLLSARRLSLSVFGGAVVLLVYGGIMNPASVLMYQTAPNWKMFLTAYLTGIPADLVHAGATALFLWFLSEPMLEKLERVKVKYGLLGGAL